MTADIRAAASSRAAVPLVVSELTVNMRRRDVPIVRRVSFEVPAGEIMGLVGESGCGKSTVAVALLGHARKGLTIATGSVRIGDIDILALSPSELRQARGRLVSYVPQDPASSLNPAIRVGDQLREALSVHAGVLAPGESLDDRIRQVLEEVNLPSTERILRSFPHQLSGGQQQRIGIGMAFACRPRLIVMDEPTTGLDVTTQRRVLDTILQLTRDHGTTVVYVSHDLPVVGQLARTTAVMYAGRIVEQGPTEELFRHPRHHYTSGLVNAAPSGARATALVGIPGRPPRPGSWPTGCTFAARCPAAGPECRAELPALADLDTSHRVRCLHPIPDQRIAPTRAPSPRPDEAVGSSLTVSGLQARYGRTTVLHDVGLDVRAGRCTAIVGESGSGKTTLAQCLVGLNSQWSGQVTLDGVELAASARKRTDDQRRRLQYIFQNPYGSLNPRQSVAENLDETLRHFERLPSDARRDRIESILETVALSADFADRMPDQLSGGERQRVAIGRALIVNPTVLVCDEVTSALDVSVQALIVEQLRDLQRRTGLTMLFITHNLAVVQSIAQDVVVLRRGRIVERGAVAEVLDHPQHEYTIQLLRDLPLMDAAVQAVAATAS